MRGDTSSVLARTAAILALLNRLKSEQHGIQWEIDEALERFAKDHF